MMALGRPWGSRALGRFGFPVEMSSLRGFEPVPGLLLSSAFRVYHRGMED